jgi:4-amino-4-deoxy-L-arabinose transferase-like glycosyltransferase
MTTPQPNLVAGLRLRTGQRSFLLEVMVVVAITLIAVFLRYYQIEQVPPGLNSDEAVGAVGALETLRSGPQLYYSGQGGGGSLGFYIAAIGFALFGPSVATIRGTAAFAGVVSVVATYFATREMFRHGRTTNLNRARLLAALAALGLATSLWHTQSSRIAFAAIGVPFLQVPGNYFLWRGLNTGRRIHFVISGVFLASLMYIYLSGSFAPFVYLFFFLLQWLITAIHPNPRPSLLKQHFWNLVICAGVAFLLFLPMLYFYLSAPELATGRAQQALFTNPLINRGDPWGTLWRSIWGNLAAFGFSTAWLRGQPPANLILPVPVSLLFLLGFAISLWRVRRPPYLFTLVYWAVMLIPSILSPDSIPHPLRAVGAAPAAYTLVAVGATGILDLVFGIVARGWELPAWRPVLDRASPGPVSVPGRGGPGSQDGQIPALNHLLSAVVLLALGGVVARPLYQDFHYYMVDWPKTNDAKAGYHVYAVELAAEMSKETNPQATFLLPRDTAAGDVNPNYTVMFLYTGQAGYAWVVDNEDTLEASLNDAVQGRDVVHVVRWKTSKHTGADPKEIIRYYLEKHGTFVQRQSFEYYDIETYRLERLGPDLADGPLTPVDVGFGRQITLTAYAFGDASGTEPAVEYPKPAVPAGDLLWARLRFSLAAPSDEDLKASVIVADSAGHVVGQIDKLLLNNVLHQGSTHWQPGTEVDAYFLVPIAPATAPGDYHLGVAIYGADSLARLPATSGDSAQVVTLGTLAVRPDLSPPPADVLGLSLALNQPVTNDLTLLGFATTAGEALRPGDRASLALVWRADQVPSNDYLASLWAIQEEKDWPLTNSLPLAGIDYPSSHWAAGQVVRGWFDGRVPPDMASGDYTLGVRVTHAGGGLVAEVPLGTLRVQGWSRQFAAPPMQHAVGANFADRVQLLGYDMQPLPTGNEPRTLSITLYWRALSEMNVSYITFVHLLDESGQVVSQVDHLPGEGAFPTTGWLPREVITDEFVVPLPESGTTAATQFELGIYAPATGQRLPVVDGAGKVIDTRVLLPLEDDAK